MLDRNVRIAGLQKHIGELIRQREQLQQHETRLHDQYERVSISHTFLLDCILSTDLSCDV